LREAWISQPGRHVIYCSGRKGFVKLAIKYGADIVPVYSFGENDLYTIIDQPEGSTLCNVQNRLKQLIGFAPPLFYGRGIFNYGFGLLPHRRPITSVVGQPIRIEQNAHPTHAQVNAVHEQYVQGVIDLFETHKHKFGIAVHQHLEVM